VAVNFFSEENWNTRRKQVSDTLSHNVVSSTPRLNGIRPHNVSDDMY